MKLNHFTRPITFRFTGIVRLAKMLMKTRKQQLLTIKITNWL